MKKRKVYFRADGHAKMGLGHVIRSLALADMLKDEFECHFIIRTPLPTLREQILEVCESIIPLSDTNNTIEEAKLITHSYLTGNEIVVLDGYHFITEYQQIIKDKGCKVVCIDDIHAYHFVADAVINHAPGLDKASYSIQPYTKLCLGLDYSLLRKPFLKAAKQIHSLTSIKNIFVCFGGADFNNITLKVLKAFIDYNIPIRQINVVLGGANSFKKSIKAFVETISTPIINLHSNLSALEMCRLMEKSDLAIVPASSILYEIIAVKMPVISGYYVDNQINIYHGFNSLNLIYGIGDFNTFADYKKAFFAILGGNNTSIMKRQRLYQKGLSDENYIQLFKKLSA